MLYTSTFCLLLHKLTFSDINKEKNLIQNPWWAAEILPPPSTPPPLPPPGPIVTCSPSHQCLTCWPVSWGWWEPRRPAGSLCPSPVGGQAGLSLKKNLVFMFDFRSTKPCQIFPQRCRPSPCLCCPGRLRVAGWTPIASRRLCPSPAAPLWWR